MGIDIVYLLRQYCHCHFLEIYCSYCLLSDIIVNILLIVFASFRSTRFASSSSRHFRRHYCFSSISFQLISLLPYFTLPHFAFGLPFSAIASCRYRYASFAVFFAAFAIATSATPLLFPPSRLPYADIIYATDNTGLCLPGRQALLIADNAACFAVTASAVTTPVSLADTYCCRHALISEHYVTSISHAH